MRRRTQQELALAVAWFVAPMGCKKEIPTTVMPQALDNAQPDPEALAATPAAENGGRGTVKLTYCVEVDGSVGEVRVVEGFGDANVDKVAVDTVQSWRFRPATRGGEPLRQCTDVTFVIEL